MVSTNKKGSLVCVGVGMTMGSHLTPLSRNYIETADVVFSLMSDGIVEQWVETMNPDVRSLQPFYQEGTSRLISYQNMINAVLDEVRQGKNVVGAFYGHPGVFAMVTHKLIAQSKKEGFYCHMEAGISAEDCLIADLGIDPGRLGCQQYEASQFMFYRRTIDTAAYLILWQPGIAGDQSLARFATAESFRAVLVELLCEYYAKDHQVILYEAKTLAFNNPRIDTLPLGELAKATIHLHTTLVIPPSTQLVKNETLLAKLNALETLAQ
ncbi:Uroporphyrin-III C/tetrapyrrole (Corrin/Porphyrin) methyltransferase [Shewanella denitrificans OS217]|uniref:Uroporphyrin-III C/tetrapyrrole (Corrin/Porphyrin) methyltransferase n=1 Tax=Shewanella denitrificans (strain OS217 / ATCC BAA-1090 / DSM 15013) TaxID=318161 RepID=Q12QN9_SHEDO|nr:SAM-dependent methyltransferase [Shewanella denitrificans]ABE54237.1 Uroporphyrin-III C/tetrapyrrole (Corrin/Porphyrin) methyltransferase [Shewanella denitrificans OS217]